MLNLRQWINWKLIQKPGKPKPDKVPFDYHTDDAIDPTDPANWKTYAEASAYGLPVGFVLTDHDPYFLLDVDGCLDMAGQWAPHVNALASMMPGAFMEVSTSGTGLHIIGSCAPIENHARKFKDAAGNQYEFYQSGRFIAMGRALGGDVSVDCTGFLRGFVPLRADLSGVDLGEGPVPEWRGPEDDDELIRVMLRANASAASVFDGKATLQDLWSGEVGALARSYPSSGEDDYDRSSADAALMQHLAFWTGKDAARMDRLFRRSGLMREKYESRPKYAEATILHAVGLCSNVFQSRQAEISPRVDLSEPVGDVLSPRAVEGSRFLSANQLPKVFEGCCYIQKYHKVLVPNGCLLGPSIFASTYGGYEFPTRMDNAKPTTNAFDAFTQSQIWDFPKADNVIFKPDLPFGARLNREGLSMVNCYVDPNVQKVQGDIEPFFRLLRALLPDEGDQRILLSFMASCAQNPGLKFQWAPVLIGAEGNGKTFFGSALEHAVGYRYSHRPKAKELSAQFNSWMAQCVFAVIEEIFIADRQDLEDGIKDMITNERLKVEQKGVDAYTGENCVKFMAFSNHKNAIRKTRNERRYCVFYTAQETKDDIINSGLTSDFFHELWSWARAGGFAAIAHYLHNLEIPAELDPAKLCQRAPDTSTTAQVMVESMGRVEQFILDEVGSESVGFRQGWISSIMLDNMLAERRAGHLSPHSKKNILEGLGYIRHPALNNGRSTLVIPNEGGRRPYLYVKADHPAANYTDAGSATTAYLDAQGYGGGDPNKAFNSL